MHRLAGGVFATALALLSAAFPATAATPPALSSPTNTLGAHLGGQYLGGPAGEASVSAGGNAVYRLPLELPAVAGGHNPQLALNYNSNVENGLLGMGWFLTGAVDAKITRCSQTIAQDGLVRAPRLDYDDVFCLNGHRLLLVSGTYGMPGAEYRTEIDQFSKIISQGIAGNGPERFEVFARDGRQMDFGASNSARVEAEASSTVRMWRLSGSTDRAGNHYRVEYHEDTLNGQSYPSALKLNENLAAGTSYNIVVDFTYEARSDDFVSYESGSTVRRHPKRLSKLEVFVDSAARYEYRFAYAVAGTRDVSRLVSVTRCDVGGTCQEPLIIEWKATSGGGYSFAWEEDVTGPGVGRMSNISSQRWHDLNGDGKSDHIMASGEYEHAVYLSGSTGHAPALWPLSARWYSPRCEILYSDLNADGNTDLILLTENPGQPANFDVGLSSPTGFTDVAYGSTAQRDSYLFVDIDADHLPDLVTIEEDQQGNQTVYDVRYALNTGSAFGPETDWLLNVPHSVDIADYTGDGLVDVMTESRYLKANSGDPQNLDMIDFGSSARLVQAGNDWVMQVEYADFNGDGLRDRKTTDANDNWVYQLNNGAGFEPDVAVNRPLAVDMNHDGTLDELQRETKWYPTPTRHRVRHTTDLGGVTDRETHTIIPWWSDYYGAYGSTDTNGDGFLDYWIGKTQTYQIPGFPVSIVETDVVRVDENIGERLNLVSKITEPSGREIEFDYDWLASGSTTYSKGTGAVLPELDIQDATRVVSRFRESDGIGGVFETTYAYEGLRWDLDRRTTLGFARITAINLDSGVTTVTDYEQSFPLAMQPKRIERRRSSDDLLLESSDLTYAVNGTIGAGPVSAFLQSRIDESYNLGDGRLLVTRSTTRSVDSYGNVTAETVETNDVENSEVRKTVTTATYSNDTLNWWIGQRLSKSTEFWLNGGMTSAQTQTTTYTYSSSTGLLETVTREPGAGAGIELTTTHTHDAFGNVLTETVACPALPARTTTYSYDARGQFPLAQTNALGHVTAATWDPVFGKRLSQSDPNGLTTTWSYDSFGNLELETRPDGTSVSTLRYEDPTGSGVFAAHYVEVIESGKPVKRVFVDRLGRTVREETLSFDGTKVLVDTEYDSKGRVLRKSEPYFAGSSPDWNVFSYDLLGRVTTLSAADPMQSTTTTYDGLSTAVTDNASRTETTFVDAAGRAIRVIARDGTELQLSYDAQGNRTRARSATGTAVQSDVDYSYDRYGRLLQQDDPDHGLYTYSYDALGQKLSEVSPAMAAAAPAQSRTFTYDLLGRMTSRTEPEGTTTWSYDDTTGGNLGLGKVHSESQSYFYRQYYYNPGYNGRLSSVTTVIGGSLYSQSVTYNSAGQVATETYPASPAAPAGFIVEYTYNALGYLERVQNQGGSEVYYQTLATDAKGRILSEWMGDGSTVTQSYAGVSSRITSQLSQHTAVVQEFSYTYDAVGNMLTRSDDLQALSESFSYDSLDRLTSAQVSGQAAVQYAFDEAGSITQKSDIADSYEYLMGPLHAVSLVTLGGSSRAFTYDANGNFALGTDEPSILWSSYNKPTNLSKGGIQYSFSYAPDRKRYSKQRNGETTHYVGGRFEYRSGGGQTVARHVIQAHGRAILVREDISAMVTEKYLHRDHLGSITAITSSTGAVLERLSYDAWGQRRMASTWQAGTVTTSEQRGYTGHEHLDDIGVIHMNGRVYSPSLGRMLSPDPVTQAPDDAQNYNRYTYSFNNPLKYTDPSGFQACGGELGNREACQSLLGPFTGPVGGQDFGGPRNDLDGYSDFLMDQYREQRLRESNGYTTSFSNGLDSGGHRVQAGDRVTAEGVVFYELNLDTDKVSGHEIGYAEAITIFVGTVEAVVGSMACTTVAGCSIGGPLAVLGYRNVIEGSSGTDVFVDGLVAGGVSPTTAQTVTTFFDLATITASGAPGIVHLITGVNTRIEAAWQAFAIYAGFQGVIYDVQDIQRVQD